MKRLILCLDGTWNSSYAGERRDANDERRDANDERRDANDERRVLKPSNTLKLARAILPTADGVPQVTYYDTGVGSLAQYPGKAGKLLAVADKYLGGVWGGGFEGNVEDALHFLALNYDPGDEVYLFGFSRGAATARAVTAYLDCSGGLPVKNDVYYLPILFRAYVAGHGARAAYERELAAIKKRKGQTRDIDIVPVPIKYLGVWDTVLSLGSRLLAFGNSTTRDKRIFHAGAKPSECIESARHALAIDEMRLDFRPEIWSGHDPLRHRQRWFPGVHSNIGGGYDHDGLANIAFHWVLEGATDTGLAVDPHFIAFFKPVPEGSLYQSSTLGFRLFDAVRRRAGHRSLLAHPGIELDPSVIQRMLVPAETIASEVDRRKDRKAIRTAYRPANVIELLAAQPDLTAYLHSLGIHDPLPPDVTERIEKLRAKGARGLSAHTPH